MCPSLIQIGSKTALHKQTNRQTNRQTDRHYENNGHLAVNQKSTLRRESINLVSSVQWSSCDVNERLGLLPANTRTMLRRQRQRAAPIVTGRERRESPRRGRIVSADCRGLR